MCRGVFLLESLSFTSAPESSISWTSWMFLSFIASRSDIAKYGRMMLCYRICVMCLRLCVVFFVGFILCEFSHMSRPAYSYAPGIVANAEARDMLRRAMQLIKLRGDHWWNGRGDKTKQKHDQSQISTQHCDYFSPIHNTSVNQKLLPCSFSSVNRLLVYGLLLYCLYAWLFDTVHTSRGTKYSIPIPERCCWKRFSF